MPYYYDAVYLWDIYGSSGGYQWDMSAEALQEKSSCSKRELPVQQSKWQEQRRLLQSRKKNGNDLPPESTSYGLSGFLTYSQKKLLVK